MKIAVKLIQNNYSFDLFSFVSEGVAFRVIVKQCGKGATGMVGIYIKAEKEKAQRIGSYSDNGEVDNLIDYVKEELLEEGVAG